MTFHTLNANPGPRTACRRRPEPATARTPLPVAPSALAGAPLDARLELTMEAVGADEAAAGKFERLAPGGGPGLYLTTGSLALAPGARAPVLQLEAQECRFGPLPVPLMTRESSELLLFLDRTMCVSESGDGDLTVMVRPTLKTDPNDAD